MGNGNKKKRGYPDVEEILARPWCYYCERDFDDLKILINHQKAKHFKCDRCARRLNTAGGLLVHMAQVHKETLTLIENALPNRSNLDVEIFGMEGIPEDVVNSHNARVLSQFAQAEAERRAATGNPGPGGAAGGPAKKPKFESPADLKKRLAEHKAKKAAELAAGIGSGDATPIDGVGNQSPGYSQNAAFAGSPPYPQQQIPYGGGPPNNGTYSSYPQQYGQQTPMYQQNAQPFPQQPSGFGAPAMGYNHQAFSGPQQFQPPVNQNFGPPQFQSGPPQPQYSGGPHGFGAASPPAPYPQQGQYQPPRNLTPPQRSNSLPSAPGLPQRPSFGAPPVNAFQMQQMHQGQLPGPPATAYTNQQGASSNRGSVDASQNGSIPFRPNSTEEQNGNSGPPQTQANQETADKSSSMPASANNHTPSAAVDTQIAPPTETLADAKLDDAPAEKKGKKEKDKATIMVYSDNELSPEEKMAKLPRYAFNPVGKEETVLGDVAPTATGAASGTDGIIRNHQ